MKEKSYMLAIPQRTESLKDPMQILQRLRSAPDFLVTSYQNEDGILSADITYQTESYHAEIYPMEFQLPDFYRCQHLFPDIDIQAMEAASAGLEVEMAFGKDPLSSYHLQLKLIRAMLPDAIAVLDESSEKILSGHWAALAAVSDVPPAPRYLFTAQAVSGEDTCVWLHTHGLNRCGLTELEVLNSTRETYNNHYNVLETLAKRLLEMEEPLEPKEPLYLARLTEDVAVIVTLIPWKEAISLYDEDMLGGSGDRTEGHNGNTHAIFVYPSKKAYDEGKYEPLSIYDNIISENPIYLISTAETNRMKALAAERISYLYQALENKENHVLAKIGITMDEEYQSEDNTLEHIWFEILEAKGGELTAKLTQEPYYKKGVHAGMIGTYRPEEITDWMIYTPERAVTPDDVYLMEI